MKMMFGQKIIYQELSDIEGWGLTFEGLLSLIGLFGGEGELIGNSTGRYTGIKS